MALQVFGDKPEGLVPFDEGDEKDYDNFSIKDNVGAVAIVTATGVEQVNTAAYGVKPALRCNVTVINEDGSTRDYDDALIFNRAVVNQAKSLPVGQATAVRIVGYKSKHGTTGYKFDKPTAEDLAIAAKHV